MSALVEAIDCVTLPGEPCEEGAAPGHTWMHHLFERVRPTSVLPGRVRFRLDFPGDEILEDCLRRQLSPLDGLSLQSYSPRTRTALVTFDVSKHDVVAVAAAVLRGVGEFARLHGYCDLAHHHHEPASRKTRQAQAKGGHAAGAHGHEHDHEHDHGHGHGHGHGHEHEHDHEDSCTDEGGDCAAGHDHSALATESGVRREIWNLAVSGGLLVYMLRKRLRSGVMTGGNPLGDLAALATIAFGYPIFRDGAKTLGPGKKATDDTLISIAVIASLLMRESITGLSVVVLIRLGRLLEAMTIRRSRAAIKELMDFTPSEAWRVTEGQGALRVAVSDVRRGDKLRVMDAERVPLDGLIREGQGLVREAVITGESTPVEKRVGDHVYAGSVLVRGDLVIEVTNESDATVIAQMVDAIENVREHKADVERVGQRFASKLIPVSIGISALTFLVTRDWRRSVTMLVIACPCAAGLATPTAVAAAIGSAARRGILVKGGLHLETAAGVDTLIFDKTGTLTEGNPRVTSLELTPAGEQLGRAEVLRLVGSAEQHTTHPLGQALVTLARDAGAVLEPVESVQTIEGQGLLARFSNSELRVGNARLMAAAGISLTGFDGLDSGQRSEAFFARGDTLLGRALIEDAVRHDARAVLDALRARGHRVILASGDRAPVVTAVAAALGFAPEDVLAEQLPQDKFNLVDTLRAAGHRVAMVGDGVNDAQALAHADLSIAMGSGRCDLAIETADVTLARDELGLVIATMNVADKTLRTIYTNLAASIGVNALGIAAGSMGNLTPFAAAIVHNLSTIAVVLNSFRLGHSLNRELASGEGWAPDKG
ncbi:MAG: cation-translocating P-type ATPase [Sandaracinaceae bacterium]|nr:cation-translocating P-type ATPase [Sandaracinaceae bacterium]MBK8406944.1 cation-translocating P-type ATPase [Sandaracinaceae bacterium]